MSGLTVDDIDFQRGAGSLDGKGFESFRMGLLVLRNPGAEHDGKAPSVGAPDPKSETLDSTVKNAIEGCWRDDLD